MVVSSYLAHLRIERGLSENTIRAYSRVLHQLQSRVAPRLLAELDTADLREFVIDRGGKPPTVAQGIAALRSFYRYLIEQGIREDNPALRLIRPKVRQGKPRPVPDLEARLDRLPEPYRTIAVLINETGMRLDEAKRLEEHERDGDLLLVTGKGGQQRIIPLTLAATEAIARLDARVAPAKRTIQKKFKAVGFNPHRLRHTFACELADADVDAFVLQDLLGHASPNTTRIYTRNRTPRLVEAVGRRRAR